jgi:tetratricopeptide (TPR) repeat protein
MASDNGKHDLAVYLYKKILRSKPNDFEEMKNLGASYCLLDNQKKAIETYSTLFEKFPDDPEFHFFFNTHLVFVINWHNCISFMESMMIPL